MFAHRKQILMVYFILASSLFLSGCDVPSLCDSEEISRVKSEKEGFYSVVVKENCGATTDYAFKIYVLDSDRPVTDKEKVFVADKVRNLNVQWVGDNKLLIKYESARIFSYKNFATSASGNVSIQERLISK